MTWLALRDILGFLILTRVPTSSLVAWGMRLSVAMKATLYCFFWLLRIIGWVKYLFVVLVILGLKFICLPFLIEVLNVLLLVLAYHTYERKQHSSNSCLEALPHWYNNWSQSATEKYLLISLTIYYIIIPGTGSTDILLSFSTSQL